MKPPRMPGPVLMAWVVAGVIGLALAVIILSAVILLVSYLAG